MKCVLSIFIALFFVFGCVAKSGSQIRFQESKLISAPTLTLSGIDDGEFSFVLVGDIHLGGHDVNRLRAILAAAQSHGDAFVIFLGDLVDKGKREEMQTFVNQVAEFGFQNKALYVIGNHDVFEDGWSGWKELIGPSHFDVVIGNTHFMILDSADGMIGEHQTEWLENKLRASTSSQKIILSHYLPVIPGQRTYLRLANEDEATSLMKLSSRYRVKAWLGGHYHSYIQEEIEKVIYLVAGGGGGRRMEPVKNNFYVRGTVSGNELRFEMHPF
jgi:predicted phosphodiesterase